MSRFRQTLHNLLRSLQGVWAGHAPHTPDTIAGNPTLSKNYSDLPDWKTPRSLDQVRALIVLLSESHPDSTSATADACAAVVAWAQQDPSLARGVESVLEEWAVGCPEASWAALLALPDGMGVRVAARVIRARSSARRVGLRAHAWVASATPGLRRATIERLSRTDEADEHEALLARSALGLRWARRTALSCAGDARAKRRLLAGLIPTATGLSAEGWVGAARILRVLGADASARSAWAGASLAHPSARARFSGLRASPVRGVLDFAFDPDARVAATAALSAAWSGEAGGEGSDRAWEGLQRSAHADVRSIARDVRSLRGLVWAEDTCALHGLRLRMHADPDALEHAWRRAWDMDEVGRVVLLRLASRLGLAPRVADVVVAAADAAAASGSAGARVAATAVIVAADVPKAARAVAACLRAEDARVRANAAESCPIESLHAALVELKTDPHHRVRANVLRRRVASGEPLASTVRTLVGLMESGERMDRLAGAWVTPRIAREGPMRVAATRLVERQLSREHDDRVRARLADAAGRLGVLIAETSLVA
jgi:hypothetical protein